MREFFLTFFILFYGLILGLHFILFYGLIVFIDLFNSFSVSYNTLILKFKLFVAPSRFSLPI